MFSLEDYFPYLLNRAGSRIANSFAHMLRDHDITLPIWRVLAALHDCDGQRMGRLADQTSIEVSTLSRLIGTMERKELARRERSAPGDARAVTVRLTGRGHALARRIVPVALEYEATALDGLTAEEIGALKAMLRRVYDNMARLETPAPDRPEAAPQRRSA